MVRPGSGRFGVGFWVGFWVGLRARDFPTERVLSRTPLIIGPPPLRGSFFLENGTLRDTREKNPEIGSKNVTDPSRDPSLF